MKSAKLKRRSSLAYYRERLAKPLPVPVRHQPVIPQISTGPLTIHLYAIVWNEAPFLPYFFRHYDPFVSRYVILDDGSDDGTVDILKAHPKVDFRPIDPADYADEPSVCEYGIRLKNQLWLESRGQADYVIVCDVDEVLYHPDLPAFLATAHREGYTVFKPQGWQMVSRTLPTTTGQVYEELQYGFRDGRWDKPCLFDPNRTSLELSPGGHQAWDQQGHVQWKQDEDFKLLHYRYLGIKETAARYKALKARIREGDRDKGYGQQYWDGEDTLRHQFGTWQIKQVIG